MKGQLSPYLATEGRIADIIAAIQVMGAHTKYANLVIPEWYKNLINLPALQNLCAKELRDSLACLNEPGH